MSTQTTLKPQSTLRNDGFQTTTASTSTTTSSSSAILTALSDATADTFVQKPGTASLVWWGTVQDPSSTLPASGDFIAGVTYRCKMSAGSGSTITPILYSTYNSTVARTTYTGSIGTSHGRAVAYYTRSGTTATIYTASPHGLVASPTADTIVVQGVLAALNGSYTVTATGTATVSGSTYYTASYTTATSATVSTPTAPGAGAYVSQVVNKDQTAYTLTTTSDGLWNATRVNDLTVAIFDDSTSSSLNSRPRIYGLEVIVTTANLPTFATAPVAYGASTPTAASITSITFATPTVTVNTGTAHNLVPGMAVTIAGTTANNGTYTVATTPTSTQFTYTNTGGAAAGAAGTATPVNTSRPYIKLGAYSQTDNTIDPSTYLQNGVQVRVFKNNSKADPTDNTDLVWDSGILGNVDTVQIGTDLTHGTLYYVYARTATDASGTGAQRAWSQWGSGAGLTNSRTSFTLNITPPTAPSWTSTPTWDGTLQKTTMTATGAAFTTGTQTYEIQRSNDGGTTYYVVRGAGAITPDGSYTSGSITDYEARRGTTSTVIYRVRAVGVVGGNRVASGWTNSTLANTTVTDGGGWTLRAFSSTALSAEIRSAKVTGDVAIQQEESVGVFRPLGRTTPIVVHGDLEGQDGDWTIIALGSTEWSSLQAVINSQQIVLAMDPFGGHRYVRITGRSWTQTGTYASPRYELQASYVEVGTDLTAG